MESHCGCHGAKTGADPNECYDAEMCDRHAGMSNTYDRLKALLEKVKEQWDALAMDNYDCEPLGDAISSLDEALHQIARDVHERN